MNSSIEENEPCIIVKPSVDDGPISRSTRSSKRHAARREKCLRDKENKEPSHLATPNGGVKRSVEDDSSLPTVVDYAAAQKTTTGGKIGILFLAHAGVTNPSLWEKWRLSNKAYAHRLKFFVFRNSSVTIPSKFIIDYDLHLRLRTKWCNSSIVKATIESLKVILDQHADVDMIYIVSGFDIPIQPPSALFNTRNVVTEGVARMVVPFTTVIAFTPADDSLLKEAGKWTKKDEHIRQNVTSHVQWCGLTREHAASIISYPDLGRLLYIGNRMSDTCCPDEWIVGTILTLQNVPKSATIDWTVTDQYREKGKDSSPLLWHNLDDSKRRVFWAPPQTYRTFTLGEVVKQVSRIEGNFFFRKVAPLTEEEIDRLLPPLTPVPPPPLTESSDNTTPNSPASSAAPSSAAADALAGEAPAVAAAVVVQKKEEPNSENEEEEEGSASSDEGSSSSSSSSSSASVPSTPQAHKTTNLPTPQSISSVSITTSTITATSLAGHLGPRMMAGAYSKAVTYTAAVDVGSEGGYEVTVVEGAEGGRRGASLRVWKGQKKGGCAQGGSGKGCCREC